MRVVWYVTSGRDGNTVINLNINFQQQSETSDGTTGMTCCYCEVIRRSDMPLNQQGFEDVILKLYSDARKRGWEI